MKLQHLALGARFEYEGKIFVKTGPLTATAEQGGQQIIPRYAVLKPLDVPETALAPGVAVRRLEVQKVRQAFEQFCQEADELIDPARAADWVAAKRRFVATLK